MSLTLATAFETPGRELADHTSEFMSAGTCLFRHMKFYHHRVARRLRGYRWKRQMGLQRGSGLNYGLSDALNDGSKTRVDGPFSVWTSTSTVGFPRESKI